MRSRFIPHLQSHNDGVLNAAGVEAYSNEDLLPGIAALILSADPNLTPAQVGQIMEQTASLMANSTVSGAGLANVDAAEAATDVPLASTSSIISSQPTVTANGVAATTLTVTVEDANDHLLSGVAVTLSASGADNIFGAISGTTNASGVFTTTLASTLAQSETITATEGSVQEHVAVNFATVIQTDKTTELVQVGNNYYLDSTSTGTGVELLYVGNPVVAGQTGIWTPIGAVETASGYDVAWKMSGANEFMIWDTDSSGNYLSASVLSGTSTTLEALETTFHQDLNGDGVIGFPGTIQTDVTTSLVQTGNNYYLDSTTTGTGVELLYVGNPVVAGQTGIWTPIGAVQTASGYDVAWKMSGANEFMIWNTDSSGNYLSASVLSGTSTTLESLETTFNQDLNGDGVIGVPATVIQTDTNSFGTTSLVQAGNNYYLDSTGTGTSVELLYVGNPVVAGQTGIWTPIGAVETASGYDVAWKMTGVNEFMIWDTDSSGNYLSASVLSGTSTTLEALETTFNQDLNGDGVIGFPGTIQTDVTTSLVQTGNNYYLDSTSTGTSVELQYVGNPVVAGQTGIWTPIGAVQTASGYDVAWKMSGANEFMIWNTDSSGNYLSASVLSGTSTTLEALETTFHQDLNGDGVIGFPAGDTFSLQYKGFDYVAFYNGAYEDSDSLQSLVQTGANSIEATLDYGIDAQTSQVVAIQTIPIASRHWGIRSLRQKVSAFP
jgi:hypothetical protein